MLRRRLHLGALAAFCALALPPLAAAAPSKSERIAARTIVVRFASSVPAARRAQLLARAGASSVHTLAKLGVVEARVAPSRRAAALASLRRSGATTLAQGAHVFRALDVTPTDPSYVVTPWPWNVTRLPKAWTVTTGNAGVVIAVIDTGVFSGSNDLGGRVSAGWDFVNNNGNPTDDQGHGTMVANTAAGAMNNAFGAVGACPACTVMPVKVLDSTGAGTDTNIALGIRYAVDNGADIINLSLGGSYNDPVLADAVTYAQTNNVLVVAAAGNSASSQPQYPGAFNGVVSVGASDQNGNLMSFSQFGPWVDVAAPGCVDAGNMSNTVSYSCGTSFASPLAAGAAALVWANNPALLASGVRTLLETKAMVTGAGVRNGVIDVGNMLGLPIAPAWVASPAVAGVAQSGQTLTARVAQWTGSSPITTTHQWSRCTASMSSCGAIAGATGTTYVVQDADVNSRLRFTDSASNSAGPPVPVVATPSEIVVAAFAPAPAPAQPPASVPGVPPDPVGSGTSTPASQPLPVVVAPSLPPQPPAIIGSAAPGARLSAMPGTLTETFGVTLSFAWQVLRSGKWQVVPRANDQDFEVPKSFGGLKVRVLVTARNASGAVRQQSASGPVTVKAPKLVKLKLKLKR